MVPQATIRTLKHSAHETEKNDLEKEPESCPREIHSPLSSRSWPLSAGAVVLPFSDVQWPKNNGDHSHPRYAVPDV